MKRKIKREKENEMKETKQKKKHNIKKGKENEMKKNRTEKKEKEERRNITKST